MHGLKLLPEWSAQDAVLLTWPHAQTDWVEFLADVEATFVQIATAISRYADLVVVCHDDTLKTKLSEQFVLLGIHNAHFQVIANNDSWARDHGPITVQDEQNQLHWLDFQFTGWGDKFSAELDNAINRQLVTADFLNIKACHTQQLVLEGGAIETDGNGSLLVTRNCLLNENRNNRLAADALEQQLKQLFGIRQCLWLNHGHLAGDDTDAHIDTLARFTPNQGIVYVSCDDTGDEHYQPLALMAQELTQLRNIDNQPYQLFALPWPSAKYSPAGERLPASYANFLILNGAILLPIYGDRQDDKAIAVVRAAFPGYQVHAIDCQPLIRQYGSLHCVTMQLPKGSLLKSKTSTSVNRIPLSTLRPASEDSAC